MFRRKLVLAVAALLIIGGGLAFVYLWPRRAPLATERPAIVTANHAAVPAENEPVLNFSPVYHEDNVASEQVPNYQAITARYGLHLTPNQVQVLDQNKFLLVGLGETSFVPGTNFDDMLADFDSLGGGDISDRKPEDTKLVTPDIVLHAYHRYFEMTLEQIEQGELGKNLGDFLTSLHANLAAAVRTHSGYMKERYQNLEAQIVLARVLFENRSPGKPDYFQTPDEESAYEERDKTVDSAANAGKILDKYSSDLPGGLVTAIREDIGKIYAADSVGSSPLFQQYSDDLKTDYTQFAPRSHYAKNSFLRAYFRTMMYLGRSSYFLKKDVGIVDANLLAGQIATKSSSGVTPLDPWKKIMTVTGFYAGQSDDLTYDEWQGFTAEVLGANLTADVLASPASIQKLAGHLDQLRLPKILSDVVVREDIASVTKADLLRQSLAFRVFGQRFTFDAWVLNDLTAGQEKTDVRLPSTPSALFIPAAMGDRRARDYSGAFLERDAGFTKDEVDGFFTKLDQKELDIGKVTENEWFASMGSAWLRVLGSLTHDYGDGYPRYMRAPAFLDKQIQTFLGSYAELKHDTLLYAKQSYAELGGGPGDQTVPPVVKGFVEPNMEFWDRFSDLLSRTDQFFSANGLLTDRSPLARLHDFRDIIGFYRDLAMKELQGQQISDDEYERLRTTKLSFMAQPFDAAEAMPDENSGRVALVADIHTDALKGQVLYEATGKPYLMLAVVANEQAPRVVAGLAYNHYEFTKPLLDGRLTDEDWRDWVYNKPGALPEKNFWYQSLIVK